MRTPLATSLSLVTLLLLVATSPASGQTRSSQLVHDLTAALTSHHLEAFAVRDPEQTDRFVAALLYPEVQLLVVDARVPSPLSLEAQCASSDYKGAYLALQTNALVESKLFFHDMGADGLRADAKQLTDLMYEQVKNQTVFGGDVNTGEYKRKLAHADEAYSRALRVLIAGLNGPLTANAAGH